MADDAELDQLILSAAEKAEAAAEEPPADEAAAPAAAAKKKKKKKARWKNRKAVFVNQLPYSATQEQIAAHFGSCAAVADMEVRLVMNRKNGKFRGIAFIDLPTTEAVDKALALDQSEFTNDDAQRTINVRKSVDKNDEGGRQLTARQQQKAAAAEASAENIEKMIAAALTAGTLLESDFDTRVRDFLLNVPEATAALAIEEFAAVDKSTVNNRCVLARRAKPSPQARDDPIQSAIRCFTLAGLVHSTGCIEMRTHFRRFSDAPQPRTARLNPPPCRWLTDSAASAAALSSWGSSRGG